MNVRIAYYPSSILKNSMKKLSVQFYRRKNVLLIARELLGKILATRSDGILTSGRIVEVEAYRGIGDKASHAYGGRRTGRNEVMYGEGGIAYVYLCYGIHHLFNIVTHEKNIPHAILIRALEPLKGIPEMLRRTGKKQLDHTLTRGPGNLSKALGIHYSMSGAVLGGKLINILEDGYTVPKTSIGVSERIGVDYAGEDALLKYRFYIKGNPFVSGKVK